jgi:hypothetical protein
MAIRIAGAGVSGAAKGNTRKMKGHNRRYLPLMVAVLVFAFALGAFQLSADILWLDELYSLSNMGVFATPYDLSAVIASLTEHSPNHVPLYFFLGARWAGFVGWSPLSMRYLSLLVGLLLIAWTYRFAADLLDRRDALIAALLLSTSGFVLMYFHEIRMYSLLLLLTVIHAWLYWRLTSASSAQRLHWLCFIVTAVALLYTHVFSLFVFVGLGLRHLLHFSNIRRWRGVVAAWLVSALAFLPYLPRFLRGALVERTIPALQDSALSAPQLGRDLGNIFVNGIEELWLPLALLALASFRQRRHPAMMQLVTVWAGIVLSLMLFNEFFPLIDGRRYRFFLVSMPFFFIVCAHLLMAPRLWIFGLLPFLLVWIAGGINIYGLGDNWAHSGRTSIFADIPSLHRQVSALESQTRELDKVLSFSQSKWVDWKLRHGRSIGDYYYGVMLHRDHAFYITDGSASHSPEDIDSLVDDHPYLVVVHNPEEAPINFGDVMAALEAEYVDCGVLVDRNDLVAQRFVYKSLACDREYEPIHYENGIRIIDKFADFDSDRQTVRVVTGWHVADAAQLEKYNVSIQILDNDGRNARQFGDEHLDSDVLKWYVVEVSTDSLPPGDYRAVVILYDRYSNAKIVGADLAAGTSAAILPLIAFTISG